MGKVQARAIVIVKLEIHVDDRWGDDCPISQIQKQGAESAEGMLRQWIESESLQRKVRLMEKPTVQAIIAEAASG